MARIAILAAGVLSLILVGTRGKAQADETVTSADNTQSVISLFGKTLCLSQAPPETKCDWRVPAIQRTAPAGAYAFTLFGKRYCIGKNPSGRCDFQFPAKATTPARESPVLPLLGVNLCLGDAPSGAPCDLRLPARQRASDRRASL